MNEVKQLLDEIENMFDSDCAWKLTQQNQLNGIIEFIKGRCKEGFWKAEIWHTNMSRETYNKLIEDYDYEIEEIFGKPKNNVYTISWNKDIKENLSLKKENIFIKLKNKIKWEK